MGTTNHPMSCIVLKQIIIQPNLLPHGELILTLSLLSIESHRNPLPTCCCFTFWFDTNVLWPIGFWSCRWCLLWVENLRNSGFERLETRYSCSGLALFKSSCFRCSLCGYFFVIFSRILDLDVFDFFSLWFFLVYYLLHMCCTFFNFFSLCFFNNYFNRCCTFTHWLLISQSVQEWC